MTVKRSRTTDILTEFQILSDVVFRTKSLNSKIGKWKLILYNVLGHRAPPGEMAFLFGALKFVTRGQNGMGLISVRRYEPAVWEFISSHGGRVFVDVGANVGGYSVGLASRFGLVVAVEPSPEARRILRRNMELNRLSNIRVVDKAVSSQRGPVRLFHAKRLVNYSISHPSTSYSEVETVTLGELLAEHETVDVLKVDVEGAELDVIQSGLRFITRVKYVIVEVRTQHEEEVTRLLSLRGFERTVLEERPRLLEKNILFTRRC